MIKQYVKTLNSRPLKHRKRVVYGASAVLTLLIAFVWFTTSGLLGGLNSTGEAIADNNSNAGSPNTRPFVVFGSNLSNAYDAVRGALGVKVAKNSNSNKNATATLEYVPD